MIYLPNRAVIHLTEDKDADEIRKQLSAFRVRAVAEHIEAQKLSEAQTEELLARLSFTDY